MDLDELIGDCVLCNRKNAKLRVFYGGNGHLCSKCFLEYIIVERPGHIPEEQTIPYCMGVVRKKNGYKA